MDVLRGKTLLRGATSTESAEEALADKQVVLFYFAASWCPPCRAFTPILHEFYSELIKEEEPLEVVLVSSDDSEEELRRQLSRDCPPTWLTVRHGDDATAAALRARFAVSGLPTLVAVSGASGGAGGSANGGGGRPLSTSGRREVTERGVHVFREWLAVAKAEKTHMDHSQ